MLRWMLVELFARWFGGGIIPKDARHRYISGNGRAYSITIEPVAGCMNVVEVTLHGDPVIPHTALPGLTIITRPTAFRVGATIRFLLHSADRLSATMEKLEDSFEVAELSQEAEMTEEMAERLAEKLMPRMVEKLTQPSAEDLVAE